MQNAEKLNFKESPEKQSAIFGKISKYAMSDPDLTIGAKAIYGGICTYAAGKNTAFPSVKTLCKDLKITRPCFNNTTYYKYIRQLIELGYVHVIEHRNENGQFSRNEYELINYQS